MYTGGMFEYDVLRFCLWQEPKYVPFEKSLAMVRKHQPSKLGHYGELLKKKVEKVLGQSVKLFTAVGSPLDRFHGIDGFFQLDSAVVTLDVTLNPHKDEYKADFVLHLEDFEDPGRLGDVAQRIANLLLEQTQDRQEEREKKRRSFIYVWRPEH